MTGKEAVKFIRKEIKRITSLKQNGELDNASKLLLKQYVEILKLVLVKARVKLEQNGKIKSVLKDLYIEMDELIKNLKSTNDSKKINSILNKISKIDDRINAFEYLCVVDRSVFNDILEKEWKITEAERIADFYDFVSPETTLQQQISSCIALIDNKLVETDTKKKELETRNVAITKESKRNANKVDAISTPDLLTIQDSIKLFEKLQMAFAHKLDEVEAVLKAEEEKEKEMKKPLFNNSFLDGLKNKVLDFANEGKKIIELELYKKDILPTENNDIICLGEKLMGIMLNLHGLEKLEVSLDMLPETLKNLPEVNKETKTYCEQIDCSTINIINGKLDLLTKNLRVFDYISYYEQLMKLIVLINEPRVQKLVSCLKNIANILGQEKCDNLIKKNYALSIEHDENLADIDFYKRVIEDLTFEKEKLSKTQGLDIEKSKQMALLYHTVNDMELTNAQAKRI